jgi:hypothetical protein
MPCMMIGVPSAHIVVDVAVRSELCFLGRADALQPFQEQEQQGPGSPFWITARSWMYVKYFLLAVLLARVERNAFFSLLWDLALEVHARRA